MHSQDPNTDSIELLCNRCGATFSKFLHQMADQNAQVVCPNCQENEDCTPPKASGATARLDSKKPN